VTKYLFWKLLILCQVLCRRCRAKAKVKCNCPCIMNQRYLRVSTKPRAFWPIRQIWRSMEWHDWENQTVLSGHKYIFGKLKQSHWAFRLNFFFNFNCFVTASENVAPDMKICQIFRCFLLAVTCFLFQNFKKISKLDAGRHVRADFHVNRSSDSFN